MKIFAYIILFCMVFAPATVICTDTPEPLVSVVETTTPTLETISIEETILPTEIETEPTIPETTEPEPTLPQPLSIEQIEEDWAEEATYLAKTVWGEARGISVEEQEKVIWCVLNRVDSPNYSDTIKGVVTSGAFFGYNKHNPVWEEHYTLALEVIAKWLCEKEGGEVERLLENDYFYFSASKDRTYHIFRKEW